jgi:autotransporter passenger strand-loop-strand repeat protein
MTTFTIQSGQTSTLVLNSGDVCVVQSGGTLLVTTVNSGAFLKVGGGGFASDTIVDGGTELVSGGQDIGATVNKGGLVVQSGGTVLDTFVNSGGGLTVGGGGVASGAVINSGGSERVSNGRDVGATVNNGGLYAGFVGSASDTVFSAGASGTISLDVDGMRVGSGATVGFGHFFLGRRFVSGLVIDSGGTVDVFNHYSEDEYHLSGLTIGGLLRLHGSSTFIAGPVVFSSGGHIEDDGAKRNIYGGAIISGFAIGDTIDLAGLVWEGNVSATLLPGNVLHIVEADTTLDLQLDPSQDFTGMSFELSYLESSDPDIPSGGTRVTLVSGSISQREVTFVESPLIIGSGESSHGLVVDDGASVIVNSGGSVGDVALDISAILSLSSGAFASGVFNGGGLVFVGPGATLFGVTASGAGILNDSAGAVIVGAHIIGNGAESVFGTDSAAHIDSDGTQSVSGGGAAVDTVVAAGGTQIIEAGGTGIRIVVQTDASTIVSSGATVVGSMTVDGKVEFFSGAVVSGVISLDHGGVLEIDSPPPALNYFPTSARLGLDTNATIDLRQVSFDSAGSASVISSNELKVTENGINYLFGLQSNILGNRLLLSPDGAGGSMVTVVSPNPIVFAGINAAGQNGLWRTDGSPEGTFEVSVAGASSGGLFNGTFPYFTQLGNSMVFRGKDANGRLQLWSTDGTPSGTSEISVAGAAGGGLAPSDIIAIVENVIAKHPAVFAGNDNHGKVNLWVTDGTSKGTSELSVAGASPFGLNPTNLAQAGNKVVFTGFDSNSIARMWSTDGTKAGTKEVSVVSVSNPHGYVSREVLGFEKTFFNGTATFGLHVPNLWVTNLTPAGTSELSVPGQSPDGLDPTDITGDPTNVNKFLFLNGVDANSNRNLWASDGTKQGTVEISVPGIQALDPTNLFPFTSLVLFNGIDSDGHRNLWETDGTLAGTSEITITVTITSLDPSEFSALNSSEVMFQGNGAAGGRVLYRLNTADLSAVEIEKNAEAEFALGLEPSNITVDPLVAPRSFFTGAGSALWVTNGSSTGTSELAPGINPTGLTVINSELLFNGVNGASRHGLWVSDGSSTGTSELSVAGAAPGGLDPTNFVVFNVSEALFAGTDSGGQRNLWITNATSGGTSELSVAEAGPHGLFFDFGNALDPQFILFNSEILFAGWDAARSNDNFRNPGLFKATISGGTIAGVSEVLPSSPQADQHGISPSNFVVFNDKVLFQGFDDNGGDEQLFVTDGTADGTSEIPAGGGANGLQPTQLTVLGSSTVVFAGVNLFNKHGLWTTSGALGGASEILPANAAAGGLSPTDLTVFGSKALFAGRDNSNNNLWVTDGTSSGTSELTVSGVHSGGIFFNNGHVTNPEFTVLGSAGKVLFNGVDSGGNAGLWVTDGTVSGTSELSIAGAASTGLNPNNFSVLGSAVLFPGTDSSGRQNLWITDGTAPGTSEVFSVVIPNLTPTDLTRFFTGPSVTGVSSPQTGQDLKAGAIVTIDLDMDEVAKVTGTPKLLLNDGGSASYVSGTNTDTLVFKYTVLAGQNVADLKVNSAILNGGTVKDSGGRAADLSGVTGADLGIGVDTKAPTISTISATPGSGGTVGLGGTAVIEVTLSEAVVVSGTPALKLNDGGTAFFVPGGSSNPAGGVLEFDYTVAGGQNTPDLTISSLVLGGGASITDSAGNALSPTLPASKNLHLIIDSIRPSVTSASATPSAVASGGTATIILKLSQPVAVGGAGPVLDLNDGGSATYVSGNGTTSLTFRYSAGSETTGDLKITGIESAGTVTGSAGNALSPNLSADLKIAVNANSWKTGKSGIFGAGSNWTANSPPTSSQEAVIAVAGTYTGSAISAATVAALDIANKTATLLVTSGATFTPTNGTGPDTNLGTVVVQSGGTFAPGGTVHNSGSLKAAAGGEIVFSGAVTNGSAGVILASGASARVDLDGATISGGKLQTLSGGVIETASGSTNNVLSGGSTVAGSLLKVADGTTLTLEGAVANAGTIAVSGTPNATTLALSGVTITGRGKLATSGASARIETVSGTSAAIKGGTLVSNSLLEVASASTLTLSGGTLGTGALVDAASGGTAIVSGTLTNGGTLFADGAGSLINIVGVVNGGVIEVGDGMVAIANSGAENITFLSGTGGLEIADTQAHTSAFSGRISGFGGLAHTNNLQFIDLISVTSAAGITSSYVSANAGNTSGTLFVSSGGHLVAAIKFAGSYSAANFHITSGIGGTVAITDPTVPNGGSADVAGVRTFPQRGIDLPNIAFGAQTTLAYAANATGTGGTLTVSDGRHVATVALLGSYMAGSFAATADGHGVTLITEAPPAQQQPLLARSHG